ncbi:MAG: dethiobiotin synthase [Hyphomonadaceae bacterium]|nr:dethiobiotin synthase [Hyphomonadaceae bacterium]
MTRAYIVAGAGTDIGKTHISCALLRLWREQGLRCAALKPVLSGIEDDWTAGLQARSASEDARSVTPNDATRLLVALGETPTPEAVARVAPWRFRAPLAPPAAAALEGQSLDFEAIVRACETARDNPEADRVLIETAGGVMSPLTEQHTMLDLIERIGAPVIFIAGSYLGGISHALTGLVALRNCQVAAVIISESEQSAGKLEELPATLARHGVRAPMALARRGAEAEVMEDLRALDLG